MVSNNFMDEAGNKRSRVIISRVLVVAYNISIGIIVLGLALYVWGKTTLAINILKAGILTLLATPLLRVFTTIITFFYLEKEKGYALISLTVFMILVTSIFIGKAV